jgi:MFS transporter, DHA1 family, inner membrane transport protein
MKRATAAAFLIPVTAAWNAGNVGAIVAPLADEYSVSLGAVGLASGTFFFAGMVAAGLAGSELGRRLEVVRALRIACLLGLAGNSICAVAPSFAVLVAGRVVAGVALGLALLFGGVFARAAGGVRLLGIYGAGVTLGVAGALGLGGVLEDAGVSWRVAFWISAGLALLPIPLLPARVPSPPAPDEPRDGLFAEALGSAAFWRLLLLAISSLTVPLVIGAWLVAYLASGDDLGPAEAGILSFALFVLSALMRDLGGRLSDSGVPANRIVLGGSLAGALGIAALAAGDTLGWALVAVALMGIGLSLPSALAYDLGEGVLPDRPVGGLGLLLTGANAFPIAAIPLVGAALANDNPDAAFLPLAALVLVAGIANHRGARRLERSGTAA